MGNQGATVEQLTPYIDRLLELCGMFKLPPSTTAANIVDRLDTIFSQVDGYAKSQEQGRTATLGTAAGEPDIEVTIPPGVAMSSRLRRVTPKERRRQEIAADIAKRRRIPYAEALKFVPVT